MSLQQQKDLLDKLGNLGEPIPGLDIDPIIENLAKKSEELKTVTESIDSEEDSFSSGLVKNVKFIDVCFLLLITNRLEDF
jgi:hypothetical protein